MNYQSNNSKIVELKSGLFLVEDVKAEAKKNNGVKCGYCENRSIDDQIFLMGWKTTDRWNIDHPTCGHGRYITCPECEKLNRYGCPICGCGEVYT